VRSCLRINTRTSSGTHLQVPYAELRRFLPFRGAKEVFKLSSASPQFRPPARPLAPARRRRRGISPPDPPSRLLRAYLFCAAESQNEGSRATHSAAGMLNSGRTAKILASGPPADSFPSASARVFAAVTTNRTPF